MHYLQISKFTHEHYGRVHTEFEIQLKSDLGMQRQQDKPKV